MTIVEFLTARLDEDEAGALEAAKEFGPDWIEIWSGQIDLSANLPERQPPDGRHWDAHVQTNDSRVSRHMVRHDPARVLAEVKAKRAIVQAYGNAVVENDHHGDLMARDELGIAVVGAVAATNVMRSLEEVLKHLATPYADYADYDEAWRVNLT